MSKAMGIFDDYGVDPEEIKESSFDIEDGTYRFEVAEAEVLNGTANKPDTDFFIIDYQLEDEDGDSVGSTREWFTMAEDGDSETKRAQQSMRFLKSRLKSLGVTNLKDFDGSEIIGLTGVLQLKSTPGKGANKNTKYQNVKNVRLDEAEEEAPAPKKASAKKATISKEDAAAKARVKANQAKRAAAAAEAEDDEDEDENPFGG